MKYVVFDLDQTLAELQSFYFFIRCIRLKEYMSAFRPCMVPHITQELENQLQMAYHNFVHLLLQEETSNHPIGLIRPGVLQMMKYLARLKRKNYIGHVVIYSNNRFLENLEAIRDIINVYVNTNLIESCIHWDHPIRLSDKQHPSYSKTWDALRLILINDGAPHDLHPSDVLFFDDQPHLHLQYALRTNYCLVTPYCYKPLFDRIAHIFLQAINTARINHMELTSFMVDILEYEQPIIQIEKSLKGVLQYMREYIRQHIDEESFITLSTEDRGMQMMKATIRMRFGSHRHRWTRKRLARTSMKKKQPINRDNDVENLHDSTTCSDGCHCIICGDERKKGVFCTSM